jgi:hypothetical protein
MSLGAGAKYPDNASLDVTIDRLNVILAERVRQSSELSRAFDLAKAAENAVRDVLYEIEKLKEKQNG